METQPTPVEAPQSSLPGASVPPPLPLPSAPHAYTRGCGCAGCVARRDAKRESNARHRGKPVNPFAAPAAKSAPVAGPKLSVLPPVAGAPAPAPPAKPPVLWTVDLIRPLCRQAADLAEKWDGDNLIEEAAKVSEVVAKFVASRVAWQAETKTMAVDGAAECAVKYLNITGVSAEYLPELKLGLAALAIISARQSLVTELRKMAAEEKAAKSKTTTTAQAQAVAA